MITMSSNLSRDKNVINVAIAVDFALVTVGHQVILSIVDYKLEGLAYTYHQLRFKAF